ncbi:MAG: hypothetical protein Q9M09_05585, partial [Mariprofundaceae bacterium]|nr:hypothetical protein [Mariprofundaceae bacterium]
MALFRYDLYGMEEAATRALLINWSIIHQIASPIALFGVPDMRGFLFVLLDLHWAGSLIAAKVFSMLILFASILMLYRWGERRHSAEATMIACGVLPLLPISIMQADAVGGGIYLLLALVAMSWLHEVIRESPFNVPGQMFLQAVLLGFAISIHPFALAALGVLLFLWWRDTDQPVKKRRNVTIALLIGSTIPLLLRMGWPDAAPLDGAFLPFVSQIVLGPDLLSASVDMRMGVGIMLMTALCATVLVFIMRKKHDTLAWFLVLGLLFGTLHINAAWLFMAAVTLLYLGAPALIALNQRIGWEGLVGQRGLVLLVLFIVTTTAMITDRRYQEIEQHHLMGEVDHAIALLSAEAANRDVKFLAASEWPARTMLATKRDVFPLPHVKDGEDPES